MLAPHARSPLEVDAAESRSFRGRLFLLQGWRGRKPQLAREFLRDACLTISSRRRARLGEWKGVGYMMLEDSLYLRTVVAAARSLYMRLLGYFRDRLWYAHDVLYNVFWQHTFMSVIICCGICC